MPVHVAIIRQIQALVLRPDYYYYLVHASAVAIGYVFLLETLYSMNVS